LCEKKVKAGSTSNLVTHLKLHHPKEHSSYQKNRPNAKQSPGSAATRNTKPVLVVSAITKKDLPQDDNSINMDDSTWSEDNAIDEPITQECESPKAVVASKPEADSEEKTTSLDLDSKTEDPLKLFFKTIYSSVKALPANEIRTIRRKIFDVVCEAEERVGSKS
jgi:hypothetical protein